MACTAVIWCRFVAEIISLVRAGNIPPSVIIGRSKRQPSTYFKTIAGHESFPIHCEWDDGREKNSPRSCFHVGRMAIPRVINL